MSYCVYVADHVILSVNFLLKMAPFQKYDNNNNNINNNITIIMNPYLLIHFKSLQISESAKHLRCKLNNLSWLLLPDARTICSEHLIAAVQERETSNPAREVTWSSKGRGKLWPCLDCDTGIRRIKMAEEKYRVLAMKTTHKWQIITSLELSWVAAPKHTHTHKNRCRPQNNTKE